MLPLPVTEERRTVSYAGGGTDTVQKTEQILMLQKGGVLGRKSRNKEDNEKEMKYNGKQEERESIDDVSD